MVWLDSEARSVVVPSSSGLVSGTVWEVAHQLVGVLGSLGREIANSSRWALVVTHPVVRLIPVSIVRLLLLTSIALGILLKVLVLLVVVHHVPVTLTMLVGHSPAICIQRGSRLVASTLEVISSDWNSPAKVVNVEVTIVFVSESVSLVDRLSATIRLATLRPLSLLLFNLLL